MTDQRVRDLLHETVSDVSGPDLADAAWRSGVRARRRRTASLAAGATAAVVAVAALVSVGIRAAHRAEVAARPDATFHGSSVWWAPTPAQETRLPRLTGTPLPATVDLSGPAPDLATHPLDRAVAAYAVVSDDGVERVLVLGVHGEYRTVDVSGVHPMTDPEGKERLAVGPSMLSPTGQWLMVPQQEGIELLRLSTGHWRHLYTLPGRTTWTAAWVGSRKIQVLDPKNGAYTYSIAPHAPDNHWEIGDGVARIPGRGSGRYGAARIGNGVAQAYYPGAPVPQPPRLHLAPGQSDWIGVAAGPGGHGRILVIPADANRQKGCCQVDAWLGTDLLLYDSRTSDGTRVLAWQVGTSHFWQVTRLTGIRLGQEYAVSSYAQLP